MAVDLNGIFVHSPALLFVADASGTLVHHSHALATRLGPHLREEPSLITMAGPDQRATVDAFLAELAHREDQVTCVLRVPESDGSVTQFNCIGRRAPDGLIHGQLEVLAPVATQPSASDRIEHVLLRTIMETLDIVLWAIGPDGVFVFHDGKALETAGLKPNQFLGMNIFEIYPPDLVAPIRQALGGAPSEYSSEAHGVHWRTWNVPIRGRDGEVEYCAGLTLDNTTAIRTKLELEARLATIEKQQRAIHELSAPVINIWDNVLTVPLIGTLDAERTNELIERLLDAASRSATRYVILDLTGVDALDTSIASHLLRLLRSLRLLGVDGLVTGISSDVAQTMVGLGVDLEDVRTFRSLREGLRHCMKMMYDASQVG